MKIKIEIKNRWTGKILFDYENENNTIRDTVLEAIKAKANLSEADLSLANLSEADLSLANLSEADLSLANLSEANLWLADLSLANLSKASLSKANLSEADLSLANLSKANLSKANLSKANLSKANLSEANLSEANLSKANLSKANLSKANLSEADLSVIKHDFWSILLMQKNEVAGLKKYLIDGKIDGTTYGGECACLVGTIANVKDCKYNSLLVKPNSDRPSERWFLGIRKGDNPNNSIIAKQTLKWIEEFEALIGQPTN